MKLVTTGLCLLLLCSGCTRVVVPVNYMMMLIENPQPVPEEARTATPPVEVAQASLPETSHHWHANLPE